MAHFEKKLESKEIFQGRVIRVTLDKVELENGRTSSREAVSYTHLGPLPDRRLRVYGEVAAGPPQMEEQPVALEMNIRSPNSWVIRRA